MQKKDRGGAGKRKKARQRGQTKATFRSAPAAVCTFENLGMWLSYPQAFHVGVSSSEKFKRKTRKEFQNKHVIAITTKIKVLSNLVKVKNFKKIPQ